MTRSCMCAIGLLLVVAGATGRGAPNAEARSEAFDSLRDLLAQFEMDSAFFQQFEDSASLSAEEMQPIARLMYQLQRVPPVDVQRWSRTGDDARAALADVDAHRGELVSLAGQIIRVDRQTLDQAQADDAPDKNLLRCTLRIDQRLDVFVLTSRVPSAWPIGQAIDYRAACHAMPLKQIVDGDRQTPLVLAAHLAWYPPTLLGDLGMDASLFENVQNRKPIRAEEREAFYQMLSAVGRADPAKTEQVAESEIRRLQQELPKRIRQATSAESRTLLEHALQRAEQGTSDVVGLFNQPESQHGQLKLLEGICRRAIEIHVDDSDIVQRFGIRKYFEIELFTSDAQSNPITVCTLSLPKQLPRGDNLYERVRLAGFFFKTWSYPLTSIADAPNPRRSGQSKNQLAPLLIAPRVTWLSSAPAPSTFSATVAVLLIGLISVALFYTATRLFRGRRGALARLDSSTGIDDSSARSALARLESSNEQTPDST